MNDDALLYGAASLQDQGNAETEHGPTRRGKSWRDYYITFGPHSCTPECLS